MTNAPCYYFGSKAGSLQGCSGVPAVHTCLSPDVPSGLCVTRLGAAAHDGTLKPCGKATPREARQLTVFPFRQANLDRGNQPWPDWVLSCHCCPYRREPPDAVQSLYQERDQIIQRITAYEAAETLEDREAAAAAL